MTDKTGGWFTADASEPSKAPRALRILVADDDRDAVLTLMMVLRDEGHDVRGVYRGSDVLIAVNAFDPDAVLVDIKMPGLSGYEVARLIRSKHGDSRPLLIAISGVYTQGSDRALAEIVGFNHHVAKPYDIGALLALLAPLTLPKLAP
jgi:DNA-binding response OmpR family regulator